jgi:hypothetical protein
VRLALGPLPGTDLDTALTRSLQARAQIEQVFEAVTLYGGGIGEVLGVSLAMALAMAALCGDALVHGGMPRALAASGVLVALALAALSLPEFRGPEPMPVAVAVSALSARMLAAGVWCLRPPKAG